MGILTTNNEDYGFYGTFNATHADKETAWRIAFEEITLETGCTPEGVRDFLDSRQGRHFADEVANQIEKMAKHTDAINVTAAVRHAIEVHQIWKIDRLTTKETGIPYGTPYLYGFVTFYEIAAEA